MYNFRDTHTWKIVGFQIKFYKHIFLAILLAISFFKCHCLKPRLINRPSSNFRFIAKFTICFHCSVCWCNSICSWMLHWEQNGDKNATSKSFVRSSDKICQSRGTRTIWMKYDYWLISYRSIMYNKHNSFWRKTSYLFRNRELPVNFLKWMCPCVNVE